MLLWCVMQWVDALDVRAGGRTCVSHVARPAANVCDIRVCRGRSRGVGCQLRDCVLLV